MADMIPDMKARVRAFLDAQGARYRWLEHARVFTMADCEPIGRELGAPHCKNLLLTNRQRTRFYLLLTDLKPFRTARLSRELGVSRLSFVPGEDMPALLGVEPGAASPLALLGDPAGRIRLVVDAAVARWPRVCLHPGDSTASLAMDTADVLALCRGPLGHDYDIVNLDEAPEGN